MTKIEQWIKGALHSAGCIADAWWMTAIIISAKVNSQMLFKIMHKNLYSFHKQLAIVFI